VALDLVAQLPHVDVGRSATAYAALRSVETYDYLGGRELVLVDNGRTVAVPVTAYRSVTHEQTVPHSHAKHSHWDGRPYMVGALARLVVNGDLLPAAGKQAIERAGLTPPYVDPLDNNRAQAVELFVDIERAIELVDEELAATDSAEPAAIRVRAGAGTGVGEAPRGTLIHSYRYNEDGRLQTADVITPTALNAASIEHRLRRAVEIGPRDDPAVLRRRLEMVVRAYDPCISCSVHVLDARRAP
jgi:sulfhydrogenase subunit alpha